MIIPTGHMKWFDAAVHEARLVGRSGREYPAETDDIEPPARLSGDAERLYAYATCFTYGELIGREAYGQ
ncbi:MAG: hypothetical protein M3003_13615 [Candidatus Dormibacteraeota bacterium]|nr:hypothetical protein [Candidatus Dormibacteraeota bacterium]